MLRYGALLFVSAFLLAQTSTPPPQNASTSPVYTADGRLVFPTNYREWIYLTTGMNMDYNPDPSMAGHSMFDNVFVNPESYKAFVATGTWPDKTMLVLEGRMATSKGSINKAGHYQSNDVMMRSVHVKDARLPGGWAFFPHDEEWPHQGDSDHRRVLLLPPAARRRRHFVRAVLPHIAGDCETERHSIEELSERRSRRRIIDCEVTAGASLD